MAPGIDNLRLRIDHLGADDAASAPYDLAIWAAGYEARSAWLMQSSYKPVDVGQWLRVEFIEDRDAHSAPEILNLQIGELLGGEPGHRDWDGHWVREWEVAISQISERQGRPIRLFCDYSSMPRTVYGTLLSNCTGVCRSRVESITLAYVPGVHADNVNGSRAIEGLRSLIGTEGRTTRDQTSTFVFGLGYDGVLTETVIELFQVGSFGCVYALPGVYANSVERVVMANAHVLSRAEIVATAPAWDIEEAALAFERVRSWFCGRDVILVPMGAKPHVVASILTALADETLALRFPQVTQLSPVQVTVAPDAQPHITRVRL
jgi:hypothetical protein